MKFSLDKKKAAELAKQLGLKVSFGSEESGIKIKKNEVEELFDFNDFFPELEDDFNSFVTKDQGVLKDVQNKILVHSVKVTESKVSLPKNSKRIVQNFGNAA
ncbi:TPA: hypothetical protein QC072_002307 [Bacillus cereus]|nr:hypothetical protein [Bacillus cereus]HDR8522394.1 hypothetical protein [Bacillus toyonensis]